MNITVNTANVYDMTMDYISEMFDDEIIDFELKEFIDSKVNKPSPCGTKGEYSL